MVRWQTVDQLAIRTIVPLRNRITEFIVRANEFLDGLRISALVDVIFVIGSGEPPTPRVNLACPNFAWPVNGVAN